MIEVPKALRNQPRTYYPRASVRLDVTFRTTGGAPTEPYTAQIDPRSLEIDRNAAGEADAFRLELDYRDLPLDPRGVDTIRVEIHLGNVRRSDEELSTGNDTLQLLGFVDEAETGMSDSGEVVSLRGRDYTGLFLDHEVGGTPIPVASPFANVVQRIVTDTPGAGRIPVDAGDIAQRMISTVTKKKTWTPEEGDDAWTVLTDLGGLFGRVPTIDLDRLRFVGARTPRRSVELLYGDDVASLRYSRGLTGRKRKGIEVRCANPATGLVRVVRYPAKGASKKEGGESVIEVTPFFVEGEYTDAELTEIAQQVFERGAQPELTGTLSTHDMTDLLGQDLVSLGNADELRLRLLRDGLPSDLSDEALRNRLTHGPNRLDPYTAQALITSLRRSGDQGRFYVERATHRWSRERGYELDVQFAEYAAELTR